MVNIHCSSLVVINAVSFFLRSDVTPLSSHLTSLIKAPPITFHSAVSVTQTLQIILLLLESVERGRLVVAHVKSPVLLSMSREPLPCLGPLWSGLPQLKAWWELNWSKHQTVTACVMFTLLQWTQFYFEREIIFLWWDTEFQRLLTYSRSRSDMA